MSQVSFQDLLSGRIRLEFGNKDQLTAIKIHQKMVECAEKRCNICDGDGVITCDACNGTGEIEKSSNPGA